MSHTPKYYNPETRNPTALAYSVCQYDTGAAELARLELRADEAVLLVRSAAPVMDALHKNKPDGVGVDATGEDVLKAIFAEYNQSLAMLREAVSLLVQLSHGSGETCTKIQYFLADHPEMT